MNSTDFKLRTKDFAKRVVSVCRALPPNRESQLIQRQLFRSGTSVGANYREACRARSTAEFIAKLGIVEAEADETLYWLELIAELELLPKIKLKQLIIENHEIIAMTVASIKTLKQNKTGDKKTDTPQSPIPNPKSGILNSSKAPEPVGLYPHARRVGNLLFLSGVGPRERGKKTIPGVTLDAKGNIKKYDIAKQCHSVFRNIRYILEDAGSSWDNIVDVTVFLTNMKEDFPIYNKIYAEYFKNNKPCRTTLEINALPTPIAIELKVIATID